MTVALARLWRVADTPFGVFGYLDLLDAGGKTLHRFCTAEEDWLDNRPRESCIPAGLYQCRRSVWHKHNTPTFEITGVLGRSRILFHWGNTEEDVEGCVLLGADFGALTVRDEDDPALTQRLKWAVVQSKPTFARFMACCSAVDQFPLEVRWSPPGAWRL